VGWITRQFVKRATRAPAANRLLVLAGRRIRLSAQPAPFVTLELMLPHRAVPIKTRNASLVHFAPAEHRNQ